MKKFILAISLLAITATTVFAGNEKAIAALTPEQRVKNDFQSQVYMPRLLAEIPGEYAAEIHFQVTPKGTVVIKEIISDSDDLKHSLMYQAKSMNINSQGLDADSSYKVTVRFKVVESN